MQYSHWYYYKSILGDLDSLSRYIEISKDNYSTYSIELTRLLLSIGSEIDVVAKLLCRAADPEAPAGNIMDYRKSITSKFPHLPKTEVFIPQYSISLTPWKDWFEEKTPEWWSCYNNVKHERSNYFGEANLENVLLASAGLCILVSYLYNDSISRLSGIIPLFMFLHPKYKSGCKVLTKSDYILPDFEREET